MWYWLHSAIEHRTVRYGAVTAGWVKPQNDLIPQAGGGLSAKFDAMSLSGSKLLPLHSARRDLSNDTLIDLFCNGPSGWVRLNKSALMQKI